MDDSTATVANDAAVGSDTIAADTSNVMKMESKVVVVKKEMEIEIKSEEKPDQKIDQKVEQTPQIPFTCCICNFSMPCQYKGKTPRFARNIQFNEECYLIQDPFSPPPGNLSSKSTCEHFIVIGSDCSQCSNPVCQLNSCCIFYRKTYCSDCAHQLLNTFPAEVQSKIRKFCKRP